MSEREQWIKGGTMGEYQWDQKGVGRPEREWVKEQMEVNERDASDVAIEMAIQR